VCRGCGQERLLFAADRREIPLTGAQKNINFHHGWEEGIYLCSDCLVSLFFLPLAVVQCGPRLALLQTQSAALRRFWAEFVVQRNLKDLANGISTGIRKTEYARPENALFYIAGEIIKRWYATSHNFETHDLRLFHFTNFAAAPDCDIIDLPGKVFTFIWFAHDPQYRSAWVNFVRQHYHIRNAAFDEESGRWQMLRGKNKGEMADEDYRNNPNTIFQYLLSDRSLLPLIRSTRARRTLLPMALTVIYAKEVRGMKQDRITTILQLADRISEMVRQENAPKLLYPLEGARYIYQLRAALLRLMKKNLAQGADKPLFTTEDYLYRILPDGEPWSDVRDLLLIRIYENLHDWLQGRAETLDEETVEVPVDQEASA
jgi:CRISPR-associated protein Cst1